jgi:predicted GNAT superfamily acetyltransferase
LAAAEKTVALADDYLKEYYRKNVDKINAAHAADRRQ